MELRCWVFVGVMLMVIVGSKGSEEEEVTYDGRSLIIGGQRKLLFSGSIHYPRSTPEVSIISCSIYFKVLVSNTRHMNKFSLVLWCIIYILCVICYDVRVLIIM